MTEKFVPSADIFVGTVGTKEDKREHEVIHKFSRYWRV